MEFYLIAAIVLLLLHLFILAITVKDLMKENNCLANRIYKLQDDIKYLENKLKESNSNTIN